MKHTLFSLLLPALAAAALPLGAAPQFAPVLQDDMVLQRGESVTLWGTAANGGSVTVEWKGHRATARVTRGTWAVEFPPAAADAEGSTITATDATGSSTLRNVLVGDVWLASGQSNMEWNVRQSSPAPAGVTLHNPQVRLLRGFGLLHGLPGAYSEELYDRAANGKACEWDWRVCSPESTRDFSAVATYFALSLQKSIGVPVGIICNAKGGSSMEAWIPGELINKKKTYASLRGDKWLESPDFDAWSRGRARQNLNLMLARGEKNLRHPFAPSYQYEAAIRPLSRLNIKGVIWYQGESNADNPDMRLNATKQMDIITSWRKTFRQEKLPFLMVQLPRINDAKNRPHWAEFREAQDYVARHMDKVGLICTIDLGSTNSNVHPPAKYPVSLRLTELARSMVYGEKGLPTYPRVTGGRFSGNELLLTFDQELKTTDGRAPRGFVVGKPGDPKTFVEQEARLEGNRVIIPRARALKHGQVLRYLHTTYAEPNLVGAESGLPAFPWREDQLRNKKRKP